MRESLDVEKRVRAVEKMTKRERRDARGALLNQVLSLLLAVSMTLQSFPVTALAEIAGEDDGSAAVEVVEVAEEADEDVVPAEEPEPAEATEAKPEVAAEAEEAETAPVAEPEGVQATREDSVAVAPQATARKAAPRRAPSGTFDLTGLETGVSIEGLTMKDGVYQVNNTDPYTIELRFAEQQGYQFADDTDSQPMTFDLSAAMDAGLIVDAQTGFFDLELTVAGQPSKVSGNPFSISEDGVLTVQWNMDDPNYQELKGISGAYFSVQFEGRFSEDAGEIPFGEETLAVNVDSSSSLRVEKGVQSSFNAATGRVGYYITATSRGTNSDVHIVDALKSDSSILSIDSSSIRVLSGTQWSATELEEGVDYEIVTSDEGGFDIRMLRRLGNGEQVTVLYQADTDFEGLGEESWRAEGNDTKKSTLKFVETEGNATNEVTVSSEESEDATDTATIDGEVTKDELSKSMGKMGDPEDGKVRVPWNVTVASKPTTLGALEATVGDSFTPGDTDVMRYADDGLQVTVTRTSGNDTKSTVTEQVISWSDLDVDPATDTSFSFEMSWLRDFLDIFEEDGYVYTYVFDYATEIDLSSVSGDLAVSNGAFSNGVTVDLYAGDGDVLRAERPALTKLVDDGHETMTWTIGVDVPAIGVVNDTDGISVRDDLPSWSYTAYDENWTETTGTIYDTLQGGVEGIVVDWPGKQSNESYEIQLVTDDAGNVTGFEVTFTFVDADGVEHQGFAPASGARTITITYTTVNNEEALRYADGETPDRSKWNRWDMDAEFFMHHKNKVSMPGTDLTPVEVTGTSAPHEFSKTGVRMPDDSKIYEYDWASWDTNHDFENFKEKKEVGSVPVYRFAVVILGLTADDLNPDGTLTLTDTFDGRYLRLLDDSEYGYQPEFEPGDVASVNSDDQGLPTFFVGNRASVAIVEGDNTLTFTVSDIPTQHGSYYPAYILKYCMAVKDLDALAALAEEAVASDDFTTSLKNTVTGGTFEDASTTVDYTEEIVDKVLQESASDPRALHYVITLNPDGLDLDPSSDTLTLTDEYANIAVNFSSVKITVDGAVDEGDLVRWYSSGDKLTFIIPDGAVVVVEYDARAIVGAVPSGGKTVNLKNVATVLGQIADATKDKKFSNSGEGGGANPGVFVLKRADGDMTEALANVSFALYDAGTRSPIKNSDGTNAVFTTDSEGKTLVMGRANVEGWNLAYDHEYYLVEMEAPEGYRTNNTEYHFTIPSDNQPVYSEYKYFDGDELKIYNESETMDIPVQKGWVGEPASSVTFELWANGEKTDKTLTLDGVVDAAETSPWKGAFTNLPRYDKNDVKISYTVVEQVLEDGHYVSDGGKWVVDEADPENEDYNPSRADKGIVFTNTRHSVDVSAGKEWKDSEGNAIASPSGASVIFELMADGEPTGQTVTLDGTADDNGEPEPWVASWDDLVKYAEDGETEIVYAVKETQGYTGYEVLGDDTVEDGGVVINGEIAEVLGSFKVTKNLAETLDGAVQSSLSDDARRALAGTYAFTIYTDEAATVPYVVDSVTQTVSVTIGADGQSQTVQVDDMPVGTYYLKETSSTASGVVSLSDEVVVVTVAPGVTGDEIPVAEFTNTYETVSTTVTKKWEAGEGAELPATLTVTLTAKKQGDEAGKDTTYTLTAAEDWTKTVSGLPKFSDDGTHMVYTWSEATPSGYLSDGGFTSGATTTFTNTKLDQPTFEKKIKDVNDSTGGASGWQDSADYDIGDDVPFRLYAELPQDVTSYRDYKITFTDKLESTIDFKSITRVKVNGEEAAYQLSQTDKQNFTVQLEWKGEEGKKIADTDLNGAEVEVLFTATLNEDAHLGKQGNVNGAKLTYSNNPNLVTDSEGNTTQSDDTGETQWDYVIVFTYQVELSKVDANGEALAGAEFTLEKLIKGSDGEEDAYEEIALSADEDGVTFTATGLDDGIYRLTETKAPGDRYQAIDPIVFEVDATHVGTWDYLSKSYDASPKSRSTILTALSGEATSGSLDLDVTEDDTDMTTLVGDVENAYVTGTTSVSGTKTWKDGVSSNSHDNATEVKLTLKRSVEGGAEETVNDVEPTWDGDTFTYSGLPKYDADGYEYTYTVEEAPIKGFTQTGTAPNFVNTRTGTTEATVKKMWEDADNQDGIRPESLTVTLSNGAKVTLNEASGWEATVGNLPKYDSDGYEISYTWTESEVDGYTLSNASTSGTVTTLTNTHVTETTEATVKKVWDDKDNQDGKRPVSLTVTLSNGESVTLSAANKWTATIDNLPKYAAGKEIIYTWVEGTLPEGYTLKSQERVGTVTTITNTYDTEVTSATVKKVWDDANNQDGIRPESLTVKLSNGSSVELNQANGWQASITGLPKYANGQEIAYTWSEPEVAGYEAEAPVTSGTVTTLTNTHAPETTEATVKKVWKDSDDQDGIRPSSLTVTLSTGQTVTLNAANGWTATIEGLPRYEAGKEIAYAWTEGALPEGYELTNTSVNGTVTTLTNTHVAETTSATVKKVWDDKDNQDGKRPASLIVTLSDGQTVTLSEANNWEATITGLPKYEAGKEIIYTWAEPEVAGYEAATAAVDGTTTTLTNTHVAEITSVAGTKTWADDGDRDGLRPSSVTLRLYADGAHVQDVVVTPSAGEADAWAWRVEGLPRYAEGKVGQEISYTVSEVVPEGYVAATSGLDVTNTHEAARTSVTVSKAWEDADDQDGVRPESVSVRLTADGAPVGEAVTLSAENAWTHTWPGLYANASGVGITYAVEEVAVPEGYEASVAMAGSAEEGFSFTLTNTHEAATTTAVVTKVWEDQDDAFGVRPATLTVALLADGKPALGAVDEPIEAVLSEENDWSASVSGLPAYAAGELIAYTWQEDASALPEGYALVSAVTSELTEGEGAGATVMGTLTTLTNRRTATRLSFDKYLVGAASGMFAFQMVASDAEGKPLAGAEPMTATNGAFVAGKAAVIFEPTFSADGTYHFVVSEAEPDTPSMRADKAQFLVTVEVKDGVAGEPTYTMLYAGNDGTLESLGTTTASAFVNNDTSRLEFRSASGTGVVAHSARVAVYPEVMKLLNGSTDMLVGGDFAFELRDAEGNLVARQSNDEVGRVAFFDESSDEPGLTFDAPGTYAYTIGEVIPEGAVANADGSFTLGDIDYDGSQVTMTVTVTEADGVLAAEVSYSGYQGDLADGLPAFRNVRQGMDLEVYKVSRSGGEGLEGCVYALWMHSATGDVLLQEATSDSRGRILFTDVNLLRGQSYFFREVEAAPGHTLDPYRTAYFTLNAAGDGTELVEETAPDGWHSTYDNIELDGGTAATAGASDEA